MNNRSDDVAGGPSSGGFRFEIMLASILLAFGVFALPALIYLVGVTLLGPYLEGDAAAVNGDGVAIFYRNFFADLAAPSIRAWLIAIGPLLVICLFRLAFIGYRGSDPEPPPRSAPPPRKAAVAAAPARRPPARPQPPGRGGRRVEPRIGGD